MKKTFFLSITLFAWNIFAQNYQSLDPLHPIRLSDNKIIYNDETITLNENNIFLDGNLSDEEIKGKSFIFNYCKFILC